jgi:maltooligosyltrehalose synthase
LGAVEKVNLSLKDPNNILRHVFHARARVLKALQKNEAVA